MENIIVEALRERLELEKQRLKICESSFKQFKEELERCAKSKREHEKNIFELEQAIKNASPNQYIKEKNNNEKYKMDNKFEAKKNDLDTDINKRKYIQENQKPSNIKIKKISDKNIQDYFDKEVPSAYEIIRKCLLGDDINND